MYNRNLLTKAYFNGVRQSLSSGRRIRPPFDFAQGRLKRIHPALSGVAGRNCERQC